MIILKKSYRAETGYIVPAIGKCRCGAEVQLSHPLDNECGCGLCYNMSGQTVIPSWKCDAQGEPYDNEYGE